MRTLIAIAIVLASLGTLLVLSSERANVPAGIEVNRALGSAKNDEGFARADAPRAFHFPRDHGAHKDFRNEWWYFTGNVTDAGGQDYGFQFVIFRIALSPGFDDARDKRESSWRDNQMYMAHLALTDIEGNRFFAHERFSRSGAQLAGASKELMDVWVEDWKIKQTDEHGRIIALNAEHDQFALNLRLEAIKPVILNGDAGLSQKSAVSGNASYYYSVPRLSVSGDIRVDESTHAVSGEAWLDREWSTSALARDQLGWDWFSLQLGDGSELMLYQMRQADGSAGPYSAGSYIDRQGQVQHLSNKDFTIKVDSTWRSPNTRKIYPSRWRLSVPSLALELQIAPRLEDQELALTVVYWEGAVSLKGMQAGKDVTGRGYVELAGY